MGFLDRFKPKALQIGKDRKLKHAVSGEKAKEKKREAEEAKRREFAAVPSATSTASTEKKPVEQKKGAAQPAARKRSADTGDAYRILLRAVVSEKSTMLGGMQQYVFAVSDRANKVAVRKAVETLYGIRPFRVNILNVRGRKLRYGRTEGRTKHWKKAIVVLPAGKSIDVFRA